MLSLRYKPVISQDFSWFLFTNLQISLCLEICLKKSSSLYFVNTLSFLFVGICKSLKIEHPGGSEGFVL